MSICARLLGFDMPRVDTPIVWKVITTAFKGREVGGSWRVENETVRVRTTLGEKAAPLDDEANGVWVAWRLLREMAAEGKA
jgi:hypothetical protein